MQPVIKEEFLAWRELGKNLSVKGDCPNFGTLFFSIHGGDVVILTRRLGLVFPEW